MSLAIKYEHLEDASMRLKSTVVQYKGEPVYITDIRAGDADEIFRVYFKALPMEDALRPRKVVLGQNGLPQFEDEPERKYISSKFFDIAPFKLGYVNRAGGAAYCTRMPLRMQKQGLSSENFTAKSPKNDFNFNSFLMCPGTKDMVLNKYPSLKEAQEMLKEKKSPLIAFHRDFAIALDEILGNLYHVFYKGEKVGAYLDGGLILGDKYKCLKEILIELGVPIK